jgi:hypothetical protein
MTPAKQQLQASSQQRHQRRQQRQRWQPGGSANIMAALACWRQAALWRNNGGFRGALRHRIKCEK